MTPGRWKPLDRALQIYYHLQDEALPTLRWNHKFCEKKETKDLQKILISRTANTWHKSEYQLACAHGKHHQSIPALFPSKPEEAAIFLYAELQAAITNGLKLEWENHMLLSLPPLHWITMLEKSLHLLSAPTWPVDTTYSPQQCAVAIVLSWRKGPTLPYGRVRILLGRKSVYACVMKHSLPLVILTALICTPPPPHPPFGNHCYRL